MKNADGVEIAFIAVITLRCIVGDDGVDGDGDGGDIAVVDDGDEDGGDCIGGDDGDGGGG